MVNKKILLFGTFVLTVLVVVSIVSAKHNVFHFWGEEVQEAPFDATVTVTGAPPRIVAFRPTTDLLSDQSTPIGGSGNGQVLPQPGDFVYASVTFIVEDAEGPDNLPGLTGPAMSEGPTSGPGNINVVLNSPTNAPVGSGVTRSVAVGDCTAVPCTGGGNSNCNAATVAAGDGTDFNLQKQYTCDVIMQYYDAPAEEGLPATLIGNMWTIDVEIEDAGGLIDTVSSGDVDHGGDPNLDFDGLACTGIGDCDIIEYLTTSAVSTTGSADWTGLSVTAEDTAADVALTLDNFGNTGVNDVTVQGEDLTGVGNPSAIMQVAAFSSGPVQGAANSGACDGPSGGGPGTGADELIASTPVVISGVTVPYTAIATDTGNMNFCIWAAVDPTYLSGPIDTAYSADSVCSGAQGCQWEVLFNS